ncbi:MAG: hypothetical protein WDM89_20600 [Rhizomicrobium sp.]
MKVAFELAVAIIVTIIAIGLGGAIWGAATDNGLVVESFSVSARSGEPRTDGRRRGGQAARQIVVAAIADRVQSRAFELREQTGAATSNCRSPTPAFPSASSIARCITWLGHQTRITGEIYRTPAGLAVTARAGSDTSPTFTGSDADLDKLIRQGGRVCLSRDTALPLRGVSRECRPHEGSRSRLSRSDRERFRQGSRLGPYRHREHL